MKSIQITNRFLLVLFLSSGSICLYSQEKPKSTEFVPHVGQSGKDVIWVPTPDALVNKMLEISGVTSKDFVIDLGSGDGRTVIAAAKLGANATGIEFNPDMVALSRKKAEEAGVSERAKFIQADLFGYDLSQASVITMFLLPEINLKLRPELLNLKPGTRIVSNTFTMGEWEPDLKVTMDEITNSWNTALMWVVPAKVEGTWILTPGELKLRQEFQILFGTYTVENKTLDITKGIIKGDTLIFTIAGAEYTGYLTGKSSITGTVTTGSVKRDWSATLKKESD
jgi:SAM-dependent methyltransferase